MVVFKDYILFNILGLYIYYFSDETSYGLNTVAEVNGQLYYAGAEYPSISNAIFLWQEINNKELNDEELRKVFVDNKII